MVTTDFSETDRTVVAQVVELASQLGLSHVTLFHVHATPELTDFGEAVPLGKGNEMKDAVTKRLDQWAESLSSAQVRIRPRTAGGRAAHAIVEASKDFDLLVMADRGHGGARRFLLGSTTDRVVRGAECDVWVARVGAD